MSPLPIVDEKSLADQVSMLKRQNEILWSIIIEKGFSDLAIERGACPQSDKLITSLNACTPATNKLDNSLVLHSPRPSTGKSRASRSSLSLTEEKPMTEGSPKNSLANVARASTPLIQANEFERGPFSSLKDSSLLTPSKDAFSNVYSSLSPLLNRSIPSSSFNEFPAIDPFASPLHPETKLNDGGVCNSVQEQEFVVTFLKCEWDFDEKGKEISRYFFSIKPSIADGWIIVKKIKEFIELESSLKKSLPKFQYERWGKIGEKGLLNGNSPSSRNLKKSALEFYLTHLLMNLNNNSIVLDFVNTNIVDENDIMRNSNGVPPGQPSNFIKEGFLIKKGSFFNPWIIRYYRLKNYRLDYYQTKYGPVHGSIKLPSMFVYAYQGLDHDYRHALVLENESQEFFLILCAENDTERDEWIYHIKSVIQAAKKSADSSTAIASPAGSERTGNNNGSSPYSSNYLRSDAESIYMVPQDESYSGRDSFIPFSQKPSYEKTVSTSSNESNNASLSFNINISDPASSSVVPETTTKLFGISLKQAIVNSGLPYSSPDMLIPRVIHQCIQYLEDQQAFMEEGIFRLSGSSSNIKMLREKYDNSPGSFVLSMQEPDIHVVSGLLKLFFRELPENIVLPNNAYLAQQPESPVEQTALAKQIISDLPIENKRTLAALFSHLKKVVDNCLTNKMSTKNVAIVFSATLSIPSWLFLVLINESSELFL